MGCVGADGMDAADLPSEVGRGIRYARIVTNGANAAGDCSESAARGDTPPVASD